MPFVAVTTLAARRPGATAAAVAALVSIVAATPQVTALASSGSSHRSHSGSHSGGHHSGSSATPVPSGPPNLLTSADGTLHTAVGVYADCTGQTPLTTTESAVDTCIRGRTYFVGHNPGVFTPLMHMVVGSLITWYDGRGVAHRYRIVAVRDGAGGAGATPLAITTRHVDAQFQTCAVANGSVDRVLDAVNG